MRKTKTLVQSVTDIKDVLRKMHLILVKADMWRNLATSIIIDHDDRLTKLESKLNNDKNNSD